MLAILVIAICLALIALAYTTRRRPLVVRETPVCSYLPRDIAVPTVRRRGQR